MNDRNPFNQYAAIKNSAPHLGRSEVSMSPSTLSTSVRETLATTEASVSALNDRLDQILFCLRHPDVKAPGPEGSPPSTELLYTANRTLERVQQAANKADEIIRILGA